MVATKAKEALKQFPLPFNQEVGNWSDLAKTAAGAETNSSTLGLVLVALFVTTGKALVTSSDALVPSSVLVTTSKALVALFVIGLTLIGHID